MRRSIGALTATAAVLAFGLACSDGSEPTKPVEPDPSAWTLTKVSGDMQSVAAMDTLTNRLIVRLRDGRGQDLHNRQIRFELLSGNGEVIAKPGASLLPQEVNMPTDWTGRAAVNFRNFGGETSTVTARVSERPELVVSFTIYSN